MRISRGTGIKTTTMMMTRCVGSDFDVLQVRLVGYCGYIYVGKWERLGKEAQKER